MSDSAPYARSATEMLDAAVRLLRRHFAVFVTLGLVGTVPPLLMRMALLVSAGGDPVVLLTNLGRWSAISTPVAIVCSTLMFGALSQASDDALRSGAPDVGAALRVAGTRLAAVLGVAVLATLAIAVGFVLLIVPGVYLALRLTTALPICVLERRGTIDSLRTAWRRSEGYALHSLAVLLLLVLITLVPALAVGAVVGVVGTVALSPTSTAYLVLNQAVLGLVTAVTYPLAGIVTTLLAYDLRVRREGYDVEAMVEALGEQPVR